MYILSLTLDIKLIQFDTEFGRNIQLEKKFQIRDVTNLLVIAKGRPLFSSG